MSAATVAPAPIRRGVYVVFVGSKQTRATYRKREALAFARKNPGAEVRGMPRHLWRDGGPYGWDGPTFRISSTLIYRNPQPLED